MGYKRNDVYFDRGSFRVSGDVIDIYPAYSEEEAIRVEFFGDEVESINYFEVFLNKKLQNLNKVVIYAANQFIVGHERLQKAIKLIEQELDERLEYFKKEDKLVEYQRLKQRVEFDLEMLQSTGACKGVENYARYLTGIEPGGTPYSLFDYFEAMNQEYLVIVDESHVSLPQFRGMFAGDRSRKEVLVEYGFRLPSALDNRPLMFDEFIHKAPRYLFVSATPKELELELIDAGLEEIEEEDGVVLVYGDYTNFGSLNSAFERLGIAITKATLERIANTPITPTEEQMPDIEKIIERIEEDDDVQAVYTNLG